MCFSFSTPNIEMCTYTCMPDILVYIIIHLSTVVIDLWREKIAVFIDELTQPTDSSNSNSEVVCNFTASTSATQLLVAKCAIFER